MTSRREQQSSGGRPSLMADAGDVRVLTASSIASSSSSSSSSVDASIVRNTCSSKVYANGCVEKRTCRDCLGVAANGDGLECFLDAPSGQCSTFQELSLNFSTADAGVTNGSYTQQQLEAAYIYASSSKKYCSENDGACSLCEAVADLRGYAPSTNQLKKMSSDRNVCYGSNNCICVAKCEGRSWLQNAGKRCGTSSSLPSYSTPSPDSKNTESKMLTFVGLFMLVQFVVLLVLFIQKKRQMRRTREANGPYNNPSAITDDENRLQLPGWVAWQRDLRANERKGDRSFVNLDVLRPSSFHHTTISESSVSTMPLSSPPSSTRGAVNPSIERLSM